MSELLNDDIMSCSGLLVGMGYPSGSITRAGMGMGELFYPCADTGNPTGKISPGGYGYGLVVSIGYISVAILMQSSDVDVRAVAAGLPLMNRLPPVDGRQDHGSASSGR